MSDIPKSRIVSSRPFANCGVDYFGPLQIREGKRRHSKMSKAYGAIFVCFSTKAVHVELVTDLSTETFLATMKRFMARRGKPLRMYSDNSTNFVGAKRELIQLHQLLTNDTMKNKIIDNVRRQCHLAFYSPSSSSFWRPLGDNGKIHEAASTKNS